MELFFKTVLLGYFILFVSIALLGRTYLIFKKTGINALAQSNDDRHLYRLAIIFKIHLLFELGLVIDYVFNIDILTAYPFAFRSQVQHEEQHLKQKHGDDYIAYCSRVRRWI